MSEQRFTPPSPIDLRMQPGEKIVEVATRWVNLHEVASNAQWDDLGTPGSDRRAKDLLDAMLASGWQRGWAYCIAFAEAVWRTAYVELGAPASIITEIGKKLTPSVMSSYTNWQDQISHDPEPGAIGFLQKGQSWHGHAVIVVQRVVDRMATIEGNTSPDPATPEADREGDGVFKRVRKMSFEPSKGLWLRGFLNPLPLPPLT